MIPLMNLLPSASDRCLPNWRKLFFPPPCALEHFLNVKRPPVFPCHRFFFSISFSELRKCFLATTSVCFRPRSPFSFRFFGWYDFTRFRTTISCGGRFCIPVSDLAASPLHLDSNVFYEVGSVDFFFC